MTPDLALLAILFLRRVPLAQTEVPAFNAVMAALEALANAADEADDAEEDGA